MCCSWRIKFRTNVQGKQRLRSFGSRKPYSNKRTSDERLWPKEWNCRHLCKSLIILVFMYDSMAKRTMHFNQLHTSVANLITNFSLVPNRLWIVVIRLRCVCFEAKWANGIPFTRWFFFVVQPLKIELIVWLRLYQTISCYLRIHINYLRIKNRTWHSDMSFVHNIIFRASFFSFF